MLDVLKRWLKILTSGSSGETLQKALARQRAAEAALQESETHFLHLVAGVTDYAIFLLDPQGRIRSWNAGAARLKQYRSDEIIGQHFSRFYPKESLRSGWPTYELQEAERVGRFEDEGWRVRKDGSRFWANVVITALKDRDGTLRGFLKITRDLTERKHAEAKVRLSEERFRLMVEGVKDHALFMLDAQGNVSTWNAGAERNLGYSAEEIIGQHFSRFVPPEDRAAGKPAQELEIAAATGRFEEQGWRIRKDGSRFWANVILTPIRDENGQLRGFVKVNQDLSARKAAEETLQQIEERFRLMVESVKDYAIFMLDPTGNVATWNAGAERLKGWTAVEIIGQHFSNFYPADALERGWPAHELKVAAEVGRFEDEGWRVRKDGTRFWANVIITAMRSAAGELVGFAKVTRDLTERKQTEERLRQANAELESQVRQRTAELENEQKRLQITLSSIGDAVIAVDPQDRVSFLNSVARDLTGWHGTEAIGQPLERVFEIINEHTRETVENPVVKVRREGRVVGLANHTLLIARDGVERPIEDSAAPILDDEGRTQGVVLVFRDATEQRKAERLQADLHAELERQVLERTSELRASEERFRLLVDGTKDFAIFLLDPRGHVASWNPGAERLKGYKEEEIVGQHFSRFYPQEALDRRWPEHELKVAAEVGRFEDEGWRVRKDGSMFWANVVITALKDDRGNLRGFSKITRDLTARKQAEENARRLAAEQAARQTAEANAEQTRAQSEQLRITLDSIGDAVIATDAEAKVTLLNPVAEALTGWKPEEAIGQELSRVLILKNEQTGEPAENPVYRAIQDGVVVGLANHTILIARDGSKRPIEDSAAPIKDSRGNIRGCVIVFHDVSEKRAQQAALRESEARKAAMLESSLDCAITIDHDGRIVEFNPAAERTFGYRRSDVLGRDLATLIIPNRFREQYRRGMVHSVETGNGPVLNRRIEMPGLRSDGTEFPTEMSVTRLPGDDRPRFSAFLRDITERKRQEEALREADRRKDEFLATLAHELRNPLAPLRNGLEVLRLSGNDRDTWEQTRGMMARQLAHMVRLIDDLLDLSRISRGKIQLRKERVDVATVVNSAVETSRPLIEASHHRLEVTLPPNPVYLDVDPARIAQVLSNLLNNSAKYTPEEGHISLVARVGAGEIVFRVTDTGIGVPEEKLEHIFEIFTQVQESMERSRGGLGIGLNIVKRLVEMHDGVVEAHSAGPGQGSEFVVRLPLPPAGQAAPDIAPPPAVPTAAGGAPFRILIVDDNRDSADSLGMLLRMLGHETRIAYDGPEGLKELENYLPDIMLLDIGMPGLSGYEVARRIREQPRLQNVVLCAMTGWGQDEDRRKSREAGFDHHLVKPVDLSVLHPVFEAVERQRNDPSPA